VPDSVHRVTGRVDTPDGLDADVVVGADGVHSITRRARWGPGSQARLTPYVAVRGVIDQRSDGRAQEYWGGGGLFGITPSPGDRTNWFASFRAELGPRSVDAGQALELARARYAAYPPLVRDLLASVDPEKTLAQRIWVAPRLRSYVRGRVVLVGDAAHAMTPNLGRGACEALIDAVTLADLLNSRAVPDVLAAYDRRRVAPTQGLRR
jgi:2-polyprenyl-6-methoxyphenol hydroxylase-like FAD-dependent oxidoreductase